MNTENQDSYDSDFMANFSPSLVHRIMLTPPNRFDTLSIHGRPPTLTFQNVLLQEGFLSHGDFEDDGEGDKADDGDLESKQEKTDNGGGGGGDDVSAEEPLSSITRTVMRAFHDVLISQITHGQTYDPLLEMMLDIQNKLKSLIPHRKDLHEKFMVDLEQVKHSLETFEGVLKLLNDFAQRLIQLESQERSVSTQNWMNVAMDVLSNDCSNSSCLNGQQDQNIVRFICHDDNDDESTKHHDVVTNHSTQHHDMIQLSRVKFVVASAHFVHGKIVQCQSDISDFQFGHFLAPKIRQYGIEFLKRDFEQRFGGGDSGGTGNSSESSLYVVMPNMNVWLLEMIESCSTMEHQELIQSQEKRVETLIQKGWVDNILFRSPRTVEDQEYHQGCNRIGNENDKKDDGQKTSDISDKLFNMPEMFYLDATEVKTIRLATKLSVVGSALALHASNIAGAKDNVIRQDPLPYEIQQCRATMIQAMGNKAKVTQERYERAVGDAVFELARALNPHFEYDPTKEDMIRSRTTACMRGEDPVIHLLDNRMRAIFRKMMVFNPLERTQIPSSLRTGRHETPVSRLNVDVSNGIYAEALQQASKKDFINSGFSFYADELAEATVMSHNIISLAMKIHGPWVERLFLEVIQSIM